MLHQALQSVKAAFEGGERRYDRLVAAARRLLDARADSFRVEYVSLVDNDTGVEVDPAQPVPERVMCSAAIHFGNCRILDNVVCG